MSTKVYIYMHTLSYLKIQSNGFWSKYNVYRYQIYLFSKKPTYNIFLSLFLFTFVQTWKSHNFYRHQHLVLESRQ